MLVVGRFRGWMFASNHRLKQRIGYVREYSWYGLAHCSGKSLPLVAITMAFLWDDGAGEKDSKREDKVVALFDLGGEKHSKSRRAREHGE